MDRIDQELEHRAPLPPASRARLLEALRKELPEAPRPHQWRVEVVRVVMAVLLVTAGFAAALIVSGNASLGVMADRAAVFVGCFALPGPVVSGLVIQLFQLPIFGLRWLNDHTLAAPMICSPAEGSCNLAVGGEPFRFQLHPNRGSIFLF